MEKGTISKKQTALNLLANIVAYSTNVLIAFVLTPILINSLGKETYGFYPMANTIIGYLSVLMNSLNAIASRFVTVSIVRQEKDKAKGYFSSALLSNLIMGFILTIPFAVFIRYMDVLMEIPKGSVREVKILFGMVFFATVVNVTAAVYGIATFAKNRIDLRSIREIVTGILKLGLYGALFMLFKPSIVYVGIVTLVIAVVNIGFQVNYTKRLLPELKLSLQHVSLKYTGQMFSSSLWNAINTFGNTLLAGMSLILANVFYGAGASGNFSIIQTVPQFMNGIIIMLLGVFYPILTYKYAENNYDGLLKVVTNAQKVVGIVTCAVISVYLSLSEEFFTLWTPGEDALYLAKMSFIVLIPHFFIAGLWMLTNLYVVMNKVKIPAFFTVALGIVNVSIAFFCYKFTDLGPSALLWISSILQVLWIGVFAPLYIGKGLNVKWYVFYKIPIRIIVLSLMTIGGIRTLKSYLALDSWVTLIGTGGIIGMIVLVLFTCVIMDKTEIDSLVGGIIVKFKDRSHKL